MLLVDDDRMVRYTTALLLGDLGYQVSEAASAEEALGEVERGLAPDLLVTDHLMADKTGVQLAEELRQRFPQCRCWSSPATPTSGPSNSTASRC